MVYRSRCRRPVLLGRDGPAGPCEWDVPGRGADPVRSGPAGLAEGSFLPGGPVDLLVADEASVDVAFLAGVGDGTFQGVAPDLAGSLPYAVASGDFTGDGRTDLAVTNEDSGTVSILIGNGDGSFVTTETVPVGVDPFAIVTGDFNGDGNLDLAVLDQGDGSTPGDVKILLGNGQGQFTLQETIPVGIYPTALVKGDFNGDRITDLAVLDQGSTTIPGDVRVLLGNGPADSMSQSPINVGFQPYLMTAG